MRKILLLIAVLFLAACTKVVVVEQNVTTNTTCNPPYYEYVQGDCCLDEGANGVCDRDELLQNVTAPLPQQPVPNAVSAALAKFRQGVTGYYYKLDTTEYFVRGNLVRVKYEKPVELDVRINNTIRTWMTDLYVDRSVPEAIAYCDIRTEREMAGTGFHADRSRCLKIVDIPIKLDFNKYDPVLPEDWLRSYEFRTPSKVEETDQYVKEPSGWKAVNPIVHFAEGRKTVILRLETKTGLPLEVETLEPPLKTAERYSFFVHNSVKPEQVVYRPYEK